MTMTDTPRTFEPLTVVLLDEYPCRPATEPSSARRRMQTEFIVASGEGDKPGETWQQIVAVTTHHHGTSDLAGYREKYIGTTLGYFRRTRTEGSPFVGESFSPFEQARVSLSTEDCPRYSAKRLTTAHEAALAKLSTLLDDPAVLRVFNEAINPKSDLYR